MEEGTDSDDWELLSISDDFKVVKDIDGGSGYEVMKSDYFSLYSDKVGAMDGRSDEDSKGFRSDESFGDQRLMPVSEKRDLSESEGGDLIIEDDYHGLGLEIEKSDGDAEGVENLDLSVSVLDDKHIDEKWQLSDDIVPMEEAAVGGSSVGYQNSDSENPGNDFSVEGDGGGSDDVDIGCENCDQDNAGNVDFNQPEMLQEKPQECVSGGIEELQDKGNKMDSDDSMERSNSSDSTVGMSSGIRSSEEHFRGEGEDNKMAWWKTPLEVFKLFVFRIKPIWPISIAGAILAFVVVRRRLRLMKHKSRSIPLKISVDDKKASELMIRAARLNAELSMVKLVPIIRTSLSAAGVTPWPIVSLR